MFISVWGYVHVSTYATEGNLDPPTTGITGSCELTHNELGTKLIFFV